MQMLAAAGIESLTDGVRTPDEDNPRGYFEFEPVKRVATDASWVSQARGKVVKVISHLVARLPRDECYRLILVERDLEEVLASQAKMIERLGRAAPDASIVRKAFVAHQAAFDQAVRDRPEIVLLRIQHAELINSPEPTAHRIAKFLEEGQGRAIDAEAMAAVIDPELYRNRCIG
ncbi:MAG: sulfotransferase family protein [Planctomycetota bacterium]